MQLEHWPILYAILRPALFSGNEAVRHHMERLAEVLDGEQLAALRELLDRQRPTEPPPRVVHGAAGTSDAERLDWLLPNLHPANFGLEFPGGYEWDSEAEFLRKWREAIDAARAGVSAKLPRHSESTGSK